MPKTPHAADVYRDEMIAQAIGYSVHFRKSPYETITTASATLDEAVKIAVRLNDEHGKYGRRACVHAIGRNLALYPIPDQESLVAVVKRPVAA